MTAPRDTAARRHVERSGGGFFEAPQRALCGAPKAAHMATRMRDVTCKTCRRLAEEHNARVRAGQ